MYLKLFSRSDGSGMDFFKLYFLLLPLSRQHQALMTCADPGSLKYFADIAAAKIQCEKRLVWAIKARQKRMICLQF